MKRVFDRIHVWLADNAPEVLASLRPGATETAIRAAEVAMGVTLPEDVRAAYRIHDGQVGPAPDFLYGYGWSRLEEVVDTWRWLAQLMRDAGAAPARTRKGDATRGDYWHRAWVPLATREDGGLFCLDLDPGPAGDAGQVIYWWRDMPSPRRVAAGSFRDWLEDFAGELEDGEWASHPEYGGLLRVDQLDEE
jgi:cell wall assembly regulator SMI1